MQIQLRFYEELNDFLTKDKRKVSFHHTILPGATVKDVIESFGVPHTEVDLILVNGISIDFNYQLQNNDSISVYPTFESLDISPVIKLRPKPLRQSRFILDVHLGKLARRLRLLGFDTVYENNFNDQEIVQRSVAENRIILTRDVGLLKNKIITHGYWMRQTDPEKQVKEIVQRFDLIKQCNPFTRCLKCNGLLHAVEKQNIQNKLLPHTNKYYQYFVQCQQCLKLYWQGSHYQKLKKWCDNIITPP